jgi:hypothetical protein
VVAADFLEKAKNKKAKADVMEVEILSKKVGTFAASNPTGSFGLLNNPEMFSLVNVLAITDLKFESKLPLFE